MLDACSATTSHGNMRDHVKLQIHLTRPMNSTTGRIQTQPHASTLSHGTQSCRACVYCMYNLHTSTDDASSSVHLTAANAVQSQALYGDAHITCSFGQLAPGHPPRSLPRSVALISACLTSILQYTMLIPTTDTGKAYAYSRKQAQSATEHGYVATQE